VSIDHRADFLERKKIVNTLKGCKLLQPFSFVNEKEERQLSLCIRKKCALNQFVENHCDILGLSTDHIRK